MELRHIRSVLSGQRVLLTGHTGFKGSWLHLWLEQLGATVEGFSDVSGHNALHSQLLGLPQPTVGDSINDFDALRRRVREFQPDVVVHMAAQALVLPSYTAPLETLETNIMGTARLLESCRSLDKPPVVLVVTSDKCYANTGQEAGYCETDALGGHDPYSASKAAAELVAHSYRAAFGLRVATARAGNVVGGGDFAEARLVPDWFRALSSQEPLTVRSPEATRPWQHVLDCLAGYLSLMAHLLEGRAGAASAWNFGPAESSNRSVEQLLYQLDSKGDGWRLDDSPKPHEAAYLWLDSSKAQKALGWRPLWDFQRTCLETARWYNEYLTSGRAISEAQLALYCTEWEQRANG